MLSIDCSPTIHSKWVEDSPQPSIDESNAVVAVVENILLAEAVKPIFRNFKKSRGLDLRILPGLPGLAE